MAAKDLVALLNADDTALHVGARSVTLGHLGITPEEIDDTNEKFEFYDYRGRRLVVQEVEGAVDLVIDEDQEPTPQLVADRIALVLARTQVMMTREPSPLFTSRVPVVSTSLPLTLAAVAELFGPIVDPAREAVPPPDNGDDYHSWCHKNNVAH